MRYGGGRSHSDLVDDDDGDGGVTIESSDGDPFYDHVPYIIRLLLIGRWSGNGGWKTSFRGR